MRSARSAHLFAPSRCTMRAASRRAGSACQFTASAMISSRRCRGDAKCATLRRPPGLSPERERILQPGQIGLQRRDVPAELIRRCEAGQRVERGAHPRCAGVRQHVLARLGQRVLGVESSTRRKCGDSAASSGKRRSSDWQKAWIVPMRMPPGRSSTRANSARASRRVCVRRLDARARCSSPRQRRVVQRDPLAEGLLQPHRHLGGGGLGEGEALDALGLRAGQHQAQQTVGQQLGLARSGRCADEGGYRRVGGQQLFGVCAVAGPLPPPPPARGEHTPLPLPLREGRGGRAAGPLIRPHPRQPPTRPPGRAVHSPKIAARTRAAAATDSSGPARHMRRSANSAPHAHPPPPPRSLPHRALNSVRSSPA